MNERKKERMNEWMKQRKSEWNKERMNEKWCQNSHVRKERERAFKRADGETYKKKKRQKGRTERE